MLVHRTTSRYYPYMWPFPDQLALAAIDTHRRTSHASLRDSNGCAHTHASFMPAIPSHARRPVPRFTTGGSQLSSTLLSFWSLILLMWLSASNMGEEDKRHVAWRAVHRTANRAAGGPRGTTPGIHCTSMLSLDSLDCLTTRFTRVSAPL